MQSVIRGLIALAICVNIAFIGQAQANSSEPSFAKKEIPYKILTSGRQITLKSTKDIKSVMVWTSSGHRILEQKEVNASSFTFNISSTINDKVFFVMIQLQNGKLYTEKIGVQ